MHTTWEYMTARFDLKNGVFSGPVIDQADVHTRLNQLGAEGWELVSVTPIKQSGGHGTACLFATLKRPKTGH
ncbi:MAG: DUF4177 domain-containing protein [Verrucomicrobiales bacterium]|nr:DUF4177 domain-containing protein [Verrucomicrobiales bacterium]